MSKHDTDILECKSKVAQIKSEVTQFTTDYIKKEERSHLLKQQPIITSNGLPDMANTSGYGLSLETILTGQAKYNAAFQMASRPSMVSNGEVEQYVPICDNV